MLDNSVFYEYQDTLYGYINAVSLLEQLQLLEFSQQVITVFDQDTTFCVVFADNITELDKSLLDTVVYTHNPLTIKQYTEAIVRSAKAFAEDMIIEFAAENVAMGITQAEKTKAVADYLSDITRYAQTGSLHEVINSIDDMIATGIPINLSPFVTEPRLLVFKAKVVTFLTG